MLAYSLVTGDWTIVLTLLAIVALFVAVFVGLAVHAHRTSPRIAPLHVLDDDSPRPQLYPEEPLRARVVGVEVVDPVRAALEPAPLALPPAWSIVEVTVEPIVQEAISPDARLRP